MKQEIETLKAENEKLKAENEELKTENQKLKTAAAAATKQETLTPATPAPAPGSKTIMQQLTKEVKTRGYQYFDWNVIANDAIHNSVSKQTVINAVLKGVQGKNNAVILFHDSPQQPKLCRP